MADYSAHYATLGVTPETDWKALRARYRQLIKQWHPDRFADDVGGRKAAEERTKDITLAYQALERYRREFGVLPPLPMEPQPAPRPHEATPPVRSGARRDHPIEEELARETVALRRRKQRLRRRAVVVLVVLALLAYYSMDRSREEPQSDDTDVLEIESPPQPPGPLALGQRMSERGAGITRGATYGEVIAIQGVPNSTQGDTWTYGKSRIRFVGGRVAAWEEHPDDSLRINRRLTSLFDAGFFGVGAAKQDVRAIQGAPSTETESVWYYGASKVFFKDGKVIRWEESPVQPLRAAH